MYCKSLMYYLKLRKARTASPLPPLPAYSIAGNVLILSAQDNCKRLEIAVAMQITMI